MRRRFSSCGLRFGSAARCGLRTASASSIARRDASEDYMKLHRKRHATSDMGALCLPFKWCANMNMVTPDNLFCRAHAGARRHALDRSTPPGPQPLNDQAPATDLILLNRSLSVLQILSKPIASYCSSLSDLRLGMRKCSDGSAHRVVRRLVDCASVVHVGSRSTEVLQVFGHLLFQKRVDGQARLRLPKHLLEKA